MHLRCSCLCLAIALGLAPSVDAAVVPAPRGVPVKKLLRPAKVTLVGDATFLETAGPVGAAAAAAVLEPDEADDPEEAGTADAPLAGLALQLNAPVYGARGATWSRKRLDVTSGFATFFLFRVSEPSGEPGFIPGADGFAFAVQDGAPDAVGDGGCGIGYSGLPRSVAVEFDTFENTYYCGFDDPNGNHVSVHASPDGGGPNSAHEAYSVGSTSALPDLADGQIHAAYVEYKDGTLRVFVDDLLTPRVTANVDLAARLGTPDGKAYVGFTAATASAWERHEILGWWHWQQTGTLASCVPPNWVLDRAWPSGSASPAVSVYRYTGRNRPRTRYAVLADLNQSTLTGLIDSNTCPIYGIPAHSPTWFWSAAGQQVPAGQALRVAVNGTFSGVVNSQGCEHSSQVGNLSHGYLLNGRFDPGFEVDSPPSGTPGSDPRYADCQGAATCPCPSRPSRTCKSHNLVRTLSWSGNAASVAVYNTATFGGGSVIGGLDPNEPKRNPAERTYVGTRGVGGTAGNDMVVFAVTGATNHQIPQDVLNGFCVDPATHVQLDGGGSTWLWLDNGTANPNKPLTTTRLIPQAFAIYTP